MRKKTHPRRRTKQFFQKLLHSLAVFFITFGLLLLIFSILLLLKKQVLLSPLAGVFKITAHTLPVQDTSEHILADLLDKENYSIFSMTTASDSSILATLSDGKEIIFSEHKAFDQQIASLQLITKQLTIEGKRFNRIDFRFDNPVVTFH